MTISNQTTLTKKQYQHCIDTENSFYHMYILEPVQCLRNFTYEETLENLKQYG